MKIAIVLLFPFGPHSYVATLVDFHMDDVGAAADRTILDVFLAFARRQVHRDLDLLATSIADVAVLVEPTCERIEQWPQRRPTPIGEIRFGVTQCRKKVEW
jgi:hypothetical protein